MVGSNDIGRSKIFYDAVLHPLGVGEATLDKTADGHARLFYRSAGGTNVCVTEPIDDEAATRAGARRRGSSAPAGTGRSGFGGPSGKRT